MTLLTTPFFESILYALVVFGVYFLFKFLKFPDISIDNVFSFGSIVGAYFFIETDNILLGFLFVFIFGFAVGSFTSILYSYVKIPKLLAGVITFSMLFSVNLKFFGKPNIPLVSLIEQSFIQDKPIIYLISAITIIVVVFIIYMFRTNLGKSFITVGINPENLSEFGGSPKLILLIGVGFSMALVALSGFSTSLFFGFSDVTIGNGILVNSVAAIVFSQLFISYFGNKYQFLIILLGIFIYNFILYFVISKLTSSFLDYSDYKLISGIVIVVFFLFNKKNLKEIITF
jgi:putative ABC transport system permease protein